jgi:hypothetical protein
MQNNEPVNNGKKARRRRRNIIRIEKQEYPQDRLHRAVERKLSLIWAR